MAYKHQVINSQLGHSLEEHILDDSVAVVSDGRAKQLDRFRFPNDADGYRYFHRRLATVQEREEAPAVLVGMEPTNYFWKLLASDLERRQVPYRMVSPYTVKKHREGDQLSRSKNDYRDAFMIGDLLRTGASSDPALSCPPPSPEPTSLTAIIHILY